MVPSSIANFGAAHEVLEQASRRAGEQARRRTGKVSESALNLVLTIAVVAAASTYVWKEVVGPWVFPEPSPVATQEGGPLTATRIDDALWTRILTTGHVNGRSDAPVQVAVFSDFECPFCKNLHPQIRQMQALFGDTVAVILLHFPLPQHRFAEGAAVAAECSASERRFAEMEDALFARSDSFGLRSWTAYAVDAGVRDTIAFAGCLKSEEMRGRVSRGRALGEEIGLRGTPTLLINGEQYSRPLSSGELETTIRERAGGAQTRQ